MKKFEIFFVRFEKEKGVFTTAQVNRIVRGFCFDPPQRESRQSGSKKKKVKVAVEC